MKTILVSGGAGFIGTRVVQRAIESGHRAVILDNLSPQVHGTDSSYSPPSGARFIRGDVTSRGEWEEALRGVDTVVHLAAETGTGQSMYEIDRYYRVNVQGTALLLDVLANQPHEVRNVILASSRSVYGEGACVCRGCSGKGGRCYPDPRSSEQLQAHDWSPKCPQCGGEIEPVPTRENDKTSPASIYAATKLAQEEMVRIACEAMGIAHCILRLQNVYGEGQSLKNPYTGILSIFSTRLRLGRGIEVFEDGEETRDFVHVDDVAEAMIRFVASPAEAGVTLNVGRGEPVSIMALAQLLCRLAGSGTDPTVSGQYRLGDIRHNFADTSRLKAVTGWTPGIALEAGIERFWRWAASQPPADDLLDKANAELRSRKMMG